MNNKCNVCEKVFGRIYELDRHKNRKIKCIPKHQDGLSYDIQIPSNPPKSPPITEIIPPFYTNITPLNATDENHHKKCINCNKQFSRIDSYKRHMMFRCKFTVEPTKKDDNQVINLLTQIKEQQIKSDQKIEELQIKNNELRTTIDELKATSIGSVTNNTNCSNTSNTNNITVNIIKFGLEDPAKKLTSKDIQYIIGAHKNSMIQRSIERTHFNNSLPEYQNVYIPDKKMQCCIIYNGDKADLKSVEYIMEELLLNHVNNLDSYKKREDVLISEYKHADIDDIVDNFRNYKESGSENEKIIYKKTETEIKEMLYNNKDKAIDTQNRAKKRKPVKA